MQIGANVHGARETQHDASSLLSIYTQTYRELVWHESRDKSKPVIFASLWRHQLSQECCREFSCSFEISISVTAWKRREKGKGHTRRAIVRLVDCARPSMLSPTKAATPNKNPDVRPSKSTWRREVIVVVVASVLVFRLVKKTTTIQLSWRNRFVHFLRSVT